MISFLTGISRRWELMILLCSGVIIAYTLRVDISLAAPIMQEELGRRILICRLSIMGLK